MCSCAGVSLISSTTFCTNSDDTKTKETDWRIGFVQKRFAKMIEGMSKDVDENTRIKILESVGRTCAMENSQFFTKYRGNIDGLLDELKQKWAENTEHDKSLKTIRIVGKKQESCFCPFVDKSITPKDFCRCSVGFNKQIYETVIGKSVNVKIEESILNGGERCTFVVQYV
jgi:predicted ArsR family transcriptional regulator